MHTERIKYMYMYMYVSGKYMQLTVEKLAPLL